MSKARARLLDAATELFYAEGLHSVGIDRVISKAQITRATMYRHFPSKDDLVVAYLAQADEAIRLQIAGAQEMDLSPEDALRTVAQSIAEGICSPGFRGCAFLNAAAEYPDPAHPVHRAVLRHRDWFFAAVTELAFATGTAQPEAFARHFVMLRDGAMSAGCLSDPKPVCATFTSGVEGLLERLH